MTLERKVAKLLRRLPWWLVVSGVFLVYLLWMVATIYIVTQAEYALSTILGGF